jgi:glutamate-5-semialdehyde dehydrogenase
MDDAGVSLQATMTAMGQTARDGARALRLADADQRTAAIRAMAEAIRADAGAILAANARDLDRAGAAGLTAPMLERLMLDAARLEGVAAGVEAVADIPDPLGVETARGDRALDAAQRAGYRPGAHADRRHRHDL